MPATVLKAMFDQQTKIVKELGLVKKLSFVIVIGFALMVIYTIALSFVVVRVTTVANDNRQLFVAQEEDRRQRDRILCATTNARRQDIKDTFLLVLASLDPTRKSPLWTHIPDPDGIGPEREYGGLEAMLNDKLAPSSCNGL